MLICSAEAVLLILLLPFKDTSCMNCMADSNSITEVFPLLEVFEKIPFPFCAIYLLCLVNKIHLNCFSLVLFSDLFMLLLCGGRGERKLNREIISNGLYILFSV